MTFFVIVPLKAQYSGLGYREKDIQISLFPGISTNGLSSGLYYNKFSINLTSGLSAGNRYFEIAGISSSHTRSSTGIQIAGLANIVGANSYIHMTYAEKTKLVRDGDNSDMAGIQISGFLNFVRNDVKGIQFTGAFNVVNGKGRGIQFAGVGNTVNFQFQGLQMGGVYNYVGQSFGGLQISSLYNQAKSQVLGLQLAAVNITKHLVGKNESRRSVIKGRQYGLINFAQSNSGVQVGLINFTREFRGTQIGLINIFKPGPYPGGSGKLGVPIGLLNFGSFQGAKLYTDQLFVINLELTTGSCYNCSWTKSKMPINERFLIVHQNVLVYGRNLWNIFDEYSWTLGYGFERVHYNKSSMSFGDPNNKRYFFAYGLRFQHLNEGSSLSHKLNLLTRLNLELGYRLFGVYPYAGLSVNSLLSSNQIFDRGLEIMSVSLTNREVRGWIGYQVGFKIR